MTSTRVASCICWTASAAAWACYECAMAAVLAGGQWRGGTTALESWTTTATWGARRQRRDRRTPGEGTYEDLSTWPAPAATRSSGNGMWDVGWLRVEVSGMKGHGQAVSVSTEVWEAPVQGVEEAWRRRCRV